MKRIKFINLFIGLTVLFNCKDKKQEEVNINNLDLTTKPLIIAHRGGAKLAPENTLASFENAINIGVEMIEIDVHLSKDSEVITIHDQSLERTTDGKGDIKDLTLAEIKKFDAGSWFNENFKGEKVPTLSETLETINRRAILLIEIKDGDERYPGLEKKIVEEVKKQNAVDWVVIQSFNKKSVLRIKEMAPEITTFYLLGRNFNEYFNPLVEKFNAGEKINLQFDGIAPHYSSLNTENVKTIHNMGFKVFCFTVNDPEEMHKVIDYRVDGIITDSPDTLKKILD